MSRATESRAVRATIPAVVCKAHRTNGDPCRAYAILGAQVCWVHGGATPQVRAAARRRIMEEVPDLLAEAMRLALHANSEAVRARMLGDLLDRVGLKAAEELVVSTQEQTNEALDDAILTALAARGLASRGADVIDVEGTHSPIALPEATDLH